MSLLLPRLIDDLEGRVKHSNIIILPGVDDKAKADFLSAAKMAEIFSFGELPLEPDHDNLIDGHHTWVMPKLTDVEIEAWNSGLIPLPAPVVWFEFRIGNSPSALLIKGESGNVKIQRVDYDNRNSGVFTGLWATENPENRNEFHITGNSTSLRIWQRFYERASQTNKTFALNLAADHRLAIYLMLMLSSQSTELRTEIPSMKLNKSREKRGDYPFPTHRIVTIVPKRFVDTRPEGDGTHASPRLHWRRSHIRHFTHQTANAKWLASEVYNDQQGWWVTIIPRCLVGVAERGTVTHEYRVEMEKRDGRT